MTWIRWEATSPNHEIVALLAEELRVHPAQAFGHYVAACCGFGEHRPDGRADQVTDTAIELWALWHGKRGKFVAAFRSLCLETREGQRDGVGVVKGWWRQAALLREQERSRTRPGQGSREAAPKPREGTGEKPRGPSGAFPVPSRGNVDEDVYGNEEIPTTAATARANGADPPVEDGTRAAALVCRLEGAPDRWAVWTFLDRIPDGEVDAWVGRMNGYLDGLDFPAGRAPTGAQLATACRDYPASEPANPARFRAFVSRLVDQAHEPKPRRPSGPSRTRTDHITGQGAIEAGHAWAERKAAERLRTGDRDA